MNAGILKKLALIITVRTAAALGKIRQLQARFSAFFTKTIAKLKMFGAISALVFAGFGISAVAAGSAFEFEMTKVAAVSGATTDQLAKLTATARHMGATTAFTAKEAASGLLDLARAGLTVDQQIGALTSTLHLAGGAGESMATAANLIAATMKQFNLDAKESTRIADVFSTILDKTLFQSLEEVRTAMGFAGTTAATFGIELEKITALSGALRNTGVEASMAGTQIRMAFLRLAAPTEGAIKILDKYGLAAKDLNPRLNEIGDVLQTLADSGMVAEDMFEVLGARQSAFINVIKQVRNGVNDYVSLLGDLGDSAGRAADKYTQMMDTIKGRMDILKSALQEGQLALFDALRPVLEKTLNIGKMLMDKFSDSIKRNADSIREFMTNILKVGVIIGQWVARFKDVILWTGKVVVALLAVKLAIGAIAFVLGVLFSPAGILVAGIVLFIKFKDEIVNAMSTAYEAVVAFGTGYVDNNKSTMSKVTNAFKTGINRMIGFVVFLGKTVWRIAQGVYDSWKNILGKTDGAFYQFTSGFIKGWKMVGKGIADLFGWVGSQVTTLVDKMSGATVRPIQNLLDKFDTPIDIKFRVDDKLLDFVGEINKIPDDKELAIKVAIKNLSSLEKMKTQMSSLNEDKEITIMANGEEVVSKVSDIMTVIERRMADSNDIISGRTKGFWEATVDDFEDVMNTDYLGAAKDGMTKVTDVIGDGAQKVMDKTRDIFKGLKTGIGDVDLSGFDIPINVEKTDVKLKQVEAKVRALSKKMSASEMTIVLSTLVEDNKFEDFRNKHEQFKNDSAIDLIIGFTGMEKTRKDLESLPKEHLLKILIEAPQEDTLAKGMLKQLAMLPAIVEKYDSTYGQITEIGNMWYNEETGRFAFSLDEKQKMLSQFIEDTKIKWGQYGAYAFAAFEGINGAYKGMSTAVEKMSKSYFNNENRRQKIMLTIAKQTAMGAAAASLDAIAAELDAQGKLWAAKAIAAAAGLNFASAAGYAAAALAAGVGVGILKGGAGAIRERAERDLAGATKTPVPLTADQQAAGVTRPEGGSGGTTIGGGTFGSVTTAPEQRIIFSPTMTWTAENMVFAEGGVDAIERTLDTYLLNKVKEFFSTGQIETD
jgi:TP901 family phage tail tape measure protein